MKIYFAGSHTNNAGLHETYERILQSLKVSQAWVSTNVDRRAVHLPPEDVAAAEASGQPLLEQMDALVIEGTDSDQQAGYLVAYAITTRTPTLFLYQRGVSPRLFEHLTSRVLPKWVEVVAYTPRNLEPQVERFLSRLSGGAVREVPRIKFTLRVTRSIEQFLNFKIQNSKKTKADWLREQIENLMKSDTQWQKFYGQEWEKHSEK